MLHNIYDNNVYKFEIYILFINVAKIICLIHGIHFPPESVSNYFFLGTLNGSFFVVFSFFMITAINFSSVICLVSKDRMT